MAKDGTWGGEPELSMASAVLDAAVEVYGMDLCLISRYDLAKSVDVLPLLYYQDIHYDALILREMDTI